MTHAKTPNKSSEPLIIWLGQEETATARLLGRKAEVLSRAAALGFRCPVGFCVTSAALTLFLDVNDLRLPPAGGMPGKLSDSQDLLHRLGKQILRAPLPHQLLSSLGDAWAHLQGHSGTKSPAVAVRSSAGSEDLGDASFAGQYTTTLNAISLQQVEHAMRTTWASSRSLHALSYARQRRKLVELPAMSVLVQELVRPQASGTAFSANPVSGDRTEIVIDAIPGLGDLLVSGRITPDHFVLKRESGSFRVVSTQIRQKPLMSVPGLRGGVDCVSLPPDRQVLPAITESEAIAVGELCDSLQQTFLTPQDIEWAISDGKIFLLQSRPITTLQPAIADLQWTFICKKRLAWFTEMLQIEGVGKAHFKEALGLDFEFRNAKMQGYEEFLDSGELEQFARVLEANAGADEEFYTRLADASYKICSTLSQYVDGLQEVEFSELSDIELLSRFESFVNLMLEMIPVVYTEPNFETDIRASLVNLLKTSDTAILNEAFLLLTSSGKELTVVREVRQLLDLGARIQADLNLRDAFETEDSHELVQRLPFSMVSQIRAHQAEFGWINTDDVFGHAWTVHDLLARLRYLVRTTDCKSRLLAARSRADEDEAKYVALLERLKPDGAFLRLVKAARTYSHLRTHRTEVFVRSMHKAGPLLAEVGMRAGLSAGEELFFSHYELKTAVLSKLLLSSEEAAARRDASAYVMRQRRVRTFHGEAARQLLDRTRATELDTAAETIDTIEGTAASLGYAKGLAKLVHDISELWKVNDGDVLVASMTIPEFVPAMEKASAFVTDEGGITCHAAILARELGVPCVIGTGRATKTLFDGDLVEVDATHGLVRVLRRSSGAPEGLSRVERDDV